MNYPYGHVPSRPGHGSALYIGNIADDGFEVPDIFPGRSNPRGRALNHFTFMAQVNPQGCPECTFVKSAAIMHENRRTWLNIDEQGFARAGVWIRLPNGRFVVRTLRSRIAVPFGSRTQPSRNSGLCSIKTKTTNWTKRNSALLRPASPPARVHRTYRLGKSK
jgi:hypothetical protein